ncbi:F0F1 ATP synthase subunit epsilon [Tumebacillus sp. ITR2]|jgi:F-type H+-transporting ATPase subunit epsilon|uniref:ATP synthase epsilon chain n=1 Tax=Tumebacillus amylolyticus TaxID=2801339 RepID=A0ABS1J5W0_9BACL|nr:F0F1 ATP synthase subunit epsilon [Tumebacillus amylolyticus]MBL0385444.1 F0F1 ATP synthase subunit epsilon [Tumebacillus amylolyticus]
MRKMPIEIVTPERKVYENAVDLIIARGGDGDLGILAGHTQVVTTLKVSQLRLKNDGQEIVIAVSGGFLEVKPEGVSVLAEAAELPEEIDVARATRSKERAEKRLNDKSDSTDHRRAELALARAINRISLATTKR